MSTEATIDATVFQELQDEAGAEFVVELVSTFLEEAPPMLAALRAARDAGDAERLRRNAHSLKSNGRTFGATRLADLSLALERDGLASATDDVLAAVDDEYARVAAALTAMTHG